MKYLQYISVSFLLIYICFLSPYVLSEVDNKYSGRVIKVVDGDTINILYESRELRIRLAEIDAPERGQPFWKKSREALAQFVASQVYVVKVCGQMAA